MAGGGTVMARDRCRILARLMLPLALFVLGPGMASSTQAATVPAPRLQADDPALLLDRLFARLKTAPDPQTALEIEQRIWEVWTSPPDPDLARLMAEAFSRREQRDLAGAILVLDRVVAGWPDYAEGWNQRATNHYLAGNFDASLADIAETLSREPRHFGALAGRALIRLQQNKRALAAQSIAQALKIHPFLRERAMFPELGE